MDKFMEGRERTCSGFVLSAPQGRSGKTVVSIGLCALLKKRGLSIQPFKKGPDYIDPSWLTGAAGKSCRNLDLYLMSEETLRTSFRQGCQGADVAVVEGAMGLFDGLNSGRGSTAHVARLLDLPVILIVNATRMTGSIAAMVMGFQQFDPDLEVAGVILNNIAGSRHQRKLTTAVEKHCGIPVVGSIPRNSDLHIHGRHLGLIPFPEADESQAIVERVRDTLEPHLDLDKILAIASSFEAGEQALPTPTPGTGQVKIGVVMDSVFNFYYPENLEALHRAGAELVFMNSMTQSRLPEVDGLYIGGGFPEFFLRELEANIGLRRDIAEAAEDGLPVYAECAGLMYLCQAIWWGGERHEMVGLFPAEAHLAQNPKGHGYVNAEIVGENPLFPVGQTIYGHEFHHSSLDVLGELQLAYRIQRGWGLDGESDGIVYKNVVASYTHIHALGEPQWAESFVSLASGRKSKAERMHRRCEIA